jgi:DNA polymerase III alpha subunit (gram-positive type)
MALAGAIHTVLDSLAHTDAADVIRSTEDIMTYLCQCGEEFSLAFLLHL